MKRCDRPREVATDRPKGPIAENPTGIVEQSGSSTFVGLSGQMFCDVVSSEVPKCDHPPTTQSTHAQMRSTGAFRRSRRVLQMLRLPKSIPPAAHGPKRPQTATLRGTNMETWNMALGRPFSPTNRGAIHVTMLVPGSVHL